MRSNMVRNNHALDFVFIYRLVPDQNGNVQVYKKFWKRDEANYDLVPPELIYADLLNTGDPRNIETAQKISDKLLKEGPVALSGLPLYLFCSFIVCVHVT